MGVLGDRYPQWEYFVGWGILEDGTTPGGSRPKTEVDIPAWNKRNPSYIPIK